MNVLRRELKSRIDRLEGDLLTSVNEDRYRMNYHLMPPIGWLNDPNGLCQMNGIYHVFFQYSPWAVGGGLKVWGQYTSKDLIHWEYKGTPLLPDQPYDCHGVYSGSALINEAGMHLFYTGNVKLEGDFDYITTGRESNVVYVASKDGMTFEDKMCVLRNADYPENYTAHIRDPKVWKEVDDTYMMVLGGRLRSDKGAVLLYESKDLVEWQYKKDITTAEPFGYMWECPDMFKLKGQAILSISPQGLTREVYRYQNIYQSGYFLIHGDIVNEACTLGNFVEWDMGFDFYAPQTFEDEKGRRILIGWVGLPDVDQEYTVSTTEKGWQHCLTLPRELTYSEERQKVLQYPVEEIMNLRKEKLPPAESYTFENGMFDFIVKEMTSKEWTMTIGEDLVLHYAEGIFKMVFEGNSGVGRTIRKAKIKKLANVRVLVDISIVEVYINDGEYVFTTRFFPEKQAVSIEISGTCGEMEAWEMKGMEVSYE